MYALFGGLRTVAVSDALNGIGLLVGGFMIAWFGIRALGDGDFFGEWALLSSQPRANTVVAVDYCNLYALDRDKFDQVLDGFPDFAAEVRRVAEARRQETASET